MGSLQTESDFPLVRFLHDNPQVRILRYQWLDLGGVLRCVGLTSKFALSLGDKPHIISELALDLLPRTAFGPNFYCIGVDELYPDWSSLRLCRYVNEQTASVMCYVREGKPFFPEYYSCPRSILQNALKAADETEGLKFLVGCEFEFFLLDKEKSVEVAVPAEGTAGAAQQYGSQALRDERVNNLLQEIIFCLEDSGILVQSYHGEGVGYEIVTGPQRPMEAVDTVIYVREAIATIAAKRGYRATMYPLPLPSEKGTSTSTSIGAHVHFSFDNATKEQSDHFLAGLLEHLPLLCAISLPTHDSYDRVVESLGQAGKWVSWGTQNKDCPIRGQYRPGYWEFRFVDATANLYFFLAAVITLGRRALGDKLPLKQKDCAEKVITFMTPEELEEHNVVDPLPKSLTEALDVYEKGIKTGKLDPLGKDLLEKYLKTKRMEEETYGNMTEEERKKTLTSIW